MHIIEEIKEQVIFMLMEGGNIAGVNTAVPSKYLEPTVKNGLVVSGLPGVPFTVVGNKNKPYLGDIDIALESKNVANKIKFNGSDPNEFWTALETHLKKTKVKGYKIVKGLSQFHTVVPLVDERGKQLSAVDITGKDLGEPGWIQLDFFLGDLSWMSKALSAPGAESNYKAVYRNLFMVDLLSQISFKTKDKDVRRKLQINWKQGVELVDFTHDEKGKRKKLKVQKVTGDMDKFVKFLFGAKVSFKDVDSFEKLYKLFLSNNFHYPEHRKSIIDAFKTTLKRFKLPEPKELK